MKEIHKLESAPSRFERSTMDTDMAPAPAEGEAVQAPPLETLSTSILLHVRQVQAEHGLKHADYTRYRQCSVRFEPRTTSATRELAVHSDPVAFAFICHLSEVDPGCQEGSTRNADFICVLDGPNHQAVLLEAGPQAVQQPEDPARARTIR